MVSGLRGEHGYDSYPCEFMMAWTPPTALMCQSGGVEHHLREATVSGFTFTERMSVVGTKPKLSDVRYLVAIEGKSDVTPTSLEDRVWKAP
jgi:hypothetical protein